jgi:hypothetical protein
MNVPALRQSVEDKMACEYGYALAHTDLVQIGGVKFPSTEPGERGQDVHAVLAPYAEHCTRKKVPADFAYLESLCKAIGDEAWSILESCRDNLTIDWQNFMGAEISFGLDEDFRPTWSYDHDGNRVPIWPGWGIQDSGKEPIYCGIIDQLYVMPGGRLALVPDWKTHPRPFPADTVQGKRYDLAVMMHLPELTESEFSLRFVRYANAVTTKKYFRSDVPDLMDNMRRARARQVAIHDKVANQEPLRAHGGAHCTYCPCTLNPVAYPCPIMKLNPNLNMRLEERLNWKLVYGAMAAVNDKVLHQLVDGSGLEIYSQDANGKVYKYGPKESTETIAPLFVQDPDGGFKMPILDALTDWFNANPKDLIPRKGSQPWCCNLRIGWSQLKSYIKANKRELIHNRIKDLVTVKTTVEYGVTREAEVDDGLEEKKPWDASGPDELEF